jgi:glycosyltransferase involved in cell wall biosynthesis
MALGKPVIASRGGGVPEIIGDGETGLLTPMGDAQALADALVSLLRDPAKARRLGSAGYDHVRTHFTARQGARRVEEIYRRILEKNRVT